MKFARNTLVAIALVLLVVSAVVVRADASRSNHSSIELVSEVSSIAPGQTFTVGLYVMPDDHWHNYWVNPGDAGKGMKVKWSLPEGFSVGELKYPIPEIVEMGDIVTYGYSGPNTLLMEVTAPADLMAGGRVTLKGKARWLVCDDANCVPERGPVELDLPVGDGSVDIGNAGLFKTARQEQPKPVDWPAAFYLSGEADNKKVNFEVSFPVPGAREIYVYPVAEKLIDHSGGQLASVEDGLLRVHAGAGFRAERTDATGVLVTWQDGDGVQQAGLVENAPKVDGAGKVKAVAAPVRSGGDSGKTAGGGVGGSVSIGLLGAIGAAFLGGLILNLMPCVLPVLSLKALSLVKLAEKHPRWVRENGLYYTAGVVASFAALGGVLLLLRALGSEIGWGFQLQNPAILLVCVLVIVLVGLNLLGVFEVGTGLMNAGADLTEGRSNKSAFFTGVLAVVVATPCMAPFMAVATGFALTQHAITGILIFVVLGLGLAFPYLLVAFFPTARKMLPQPGAWMQVFKEVMAFPMFATALYFLWVLGNSRGVMVMTASLGAILILAISAWAWGRSTASAKPMVWRVVAAVGLAGVVWMANAGLGLATDKNTVHAEGEISWSEQGLNELLQQDASVFAYFTADWCVSCKVNEKASLHTRTVQQYFADNDIKVIVGDWTDEDAEITAFLGRYGRAGVPLYLYFKPGTSIDNAKVLPQLLLSPSAIIDELEDS